MLMVESIAPRQGMDGETPPKALVPPSGGYVENAVNGHEWVNPDKDDLQYACIFPIPTPRDCDKIAQLKPTPGCDCKSGNESDLDPVCQRPDGSYSHIQSFGKAYPGLR